jgi:hypothetical protein
LCSDPGGDYVAGSTTLTNLQLFTDQSMASVFSAVNKEAKDADDNEDPQKVIHEQPSVKLSSIAQTRDGFGSLFLPRVVSP